MFIHPPALDFPAMVSERVRLVQQRPRRDRRGDLIELLLAGPHLTRSM
jgi:hypothetical protein